MVYQVLSYLDSRASKRKIHVHSQGVFKCAREDCLRARKGHASHEAMVGCDCARRPLICSAESAGATDTSLPIIAERDSRNIQNPKHPSLLS